MTEDAMRQVISRATGKVGLPFEPTRVECHEASGPAEQRATHLCELLQVLIEDARARGLACSLEYMIAR